MNRPESHGSGIRHAVGLIRDLPKLLPRARTSPARLMQKWARQAPERLALRYREQAFTWGEFYERARHYAAWFSREGVGAGDVVALLMDNRPDYLFAVMGLSELGAASSLINTNVRGRALVHALRACHARKLLAGGEHLDAAQEVAAELDHFSPEKDLYLQLEDDQGPSAGYHVINDEVRRADAVAPLSTHSPRNEDIFSFIYTSGTTGLPKAAIIRNQRMLGASVLCGRLMHRCGPGDLIYAPLPLYHSSAMFLGWGAALVTGAALGLRRKFSASQFWDDVCRFDASSFLYIGELCRYLLNTPSKPAERAHRVRVCVGNGMRPDIWERFQERFGIPIVREFYGATEGNTAVMNLQGRPGMIGRLRRGQVIVRCDPASGEIERNAEGRCEAVRAGEVGLLLARISAVLSFDGYVDKEATQKKIVGDVLKRGDRYFNTGDLIQLHDDRWLSFADRVGDTFRWKGENVSTTEVAELLSDAGEVLEANVYGVEIPDMEGRAGMAALRVGIDFELERFAEFVGRELPKYQRPLLLRILQGEMRVTATFKHMKVDYRTQGFDPEKVTDPLYVLQDGRYVLLDADLFARITRGEIMPG